MFYERLYFLRASYSCSGGCVLHMLGAVPRSATNDDLHPKPPVDYNFARNTEPSLLCLGYSSRIFLYSYGTSGTLSYIYRPVFAITGVGLQ